MMIRFNPTAIAIQATGDNREEIDKFFKDYLPQTQPSYPPAGHWVVLFMGQVHTMTEQQFHAAQGLV
jgi:hypothetical protein